MTNGNLIGTAIGNLLAKQKGVVRRKDTILLIATGIIWLLSMLAPYQTDWPLWVSAIIGLVASVAAAIVTALTPGAITPSIRDRAIQEASRLESQVTDGLESFHGKVNDALDDARGIAEEYVGEHRLAETEPEPEANTGIAAHYTNG